MSGICYQYSADIQHQTFELTGVLWGTKTRWKKQPVWVIAKGQLESPLLLFYNAKAGLDFLWCDARGRDDSSGW